MTRIINRPVDVTTGPAGLPVSFRFAGGRERVREALRHTALVKLSMAS